MSAPGPAGDALFIDFDGTLVEIAPTPDAVRVDPGLPALLEALRARADGALAIVTGRPVADIEAFLPALRADICGLHGLERRVGGILTRPPLPDLGAAIGDLRADLAGHPGILIEDKGVGVAVHWRLAPASEPAAVAALDRLSARLGPDYRLQEGKAVREIVPASAGKGGAIRALMTAPPYAGRRPVMIGDDRTDEHGFEAAASLGGIAVKIGAGDTLAGRRLASPAALLDHLAGWLRDGAGPDGWEAA